MVFKSPTLLLLPLPILGTPKSGLRSDNLALDLQIISAQLLNIITTAVAELYFNVFLNFL